MTETRDSLLSDLDPTDPADLYCGNCGLDYTGLTVAGLAKIVERCGCPACTNYLAELDEIS